MADPPDFWEGVAAIPDAMAISEEGPTSLSKQEKYGCLMPVHGAQKAPTPVVSLNGKSAQEYFVEYMQRGRTHPLLTNPDRERANTVMSWFLAMAKPDELELLAPLPISGQQPVDQGKKMKAAKVLHSLVVERLRSAFSDAGAQLPRGLKGKNVVLLMTSIETQKKALKKKVSRWRSASSRHGAKPARTPPPRSKRGQRHAPAPAEAAAAAAALGLGAGSAASARGAQRAPRKDLVFHCGCFAG